MSKILKFFVLCEFEEDCSEFFCFDTSVAKVDAFTACVVEGEDVHEETLFLHPEIN